MNRELRIVNGENAAMSDRNLSPFQIHRSLFHATSKRNMEVLGYGE